MHKEHIIRSYKLDEEKEEEKKPSIVEVVVVLAVAGIGIIFVGICLGLAFMPIPVL